MPIGDVLLKLGKGETLSAGELDQLRVRMNFIETIASSMAANTDGAGQLIVPGRWEILGDQKLAAAANNIAFSGIPNAFRHLRMIGGLRSDVAGTGEALFIQLNDDAGNNYDSTRTNLFGDGTVTASNRLSDALWSLGGAVGNTAPASHFGAIDVFFPDYAGVTFKTAVQVGHAVADHAAGDISVNVAGGTWHSTAIIFKILAYPGLGTNWIAGSRLTLYGLSS